MVNLDEICFTITVVRLRTNLLSQRIQIEYGCNWCIIAREKPNNTVGRPIIPCRKVRNGIVYVLRIG